MGYLFVRVLWMKLILIKLYVGCGDNQPSLSLGLCAPTPLMCWTCCSTFLLLTCLPKSLLLTARPDLRQSHSLSVTKKGTLRVWLGLAVQTLFQMTASLSPLGRTWLVPLSRKILRRLYASLPTAPGWLSG